MVVRADPNQLVLSSDDYLSPAHSLLEQGAFLDNRGKPNFHRTPGYPVFLAGVMWLMGPDLRTALITQTVILSFGPLILYWLGRRILPPIPAILGGLIAALSPWGAVLAVMPMSDGLFLMLLSAIFLLMKVAVNSKASRALLLAACVGCLTSLAVLVRPIWPLLILVPAGFVFSLGFKRQGVWLLLAVSVLCAVVPVGLWRERNEREAHFNGLSDVAAQDAWEYLAARVRADVSGQNRHDVSVLAVQEAFTWGVPFWTQEMDDERWRRANAVFRKHPFRTVYSFGRSAVEHMIHPSRDVLEAGRLNFHGDTVVLALLWGGLLLVSTYAFRQSNSPPGWQNADVDQRFLIAMLFICMSVTLCSGILFAQGSRMRAPLEAIVPLLAALGLVRMLCRFHSASVVSSVTTPVMR
jgi:hypothetical protein